MRVLHLSHHYGCLKDHQYVCDQLGLELTNKLSIWNQIIERNHYVITSDYADSVWGEYKDYFNSFDYIITSDTAPLSRIFLQNLRDFDGQLIVWVCNRFNYEMTQDKEYLALFEESTKKDNVKIIPYTEFERTYASAYGVNITEEVIRPIGRSLDKPLSEEDSEDLIGFGGDYGEELVGGDLLVSRYHNDTKYQDSVELFRSYGILADTCKYKGYMGLVELAEKYHAYFILPDQYSKLAAFEIMNIGLPVILPSEDYVMRLSRSPNYWFGSGIYRHTIQTCEWYNEYFDKFAVYIDDFSQMAEALEIVKEHKDEIRAIMSECSTEHMEKTLQQWRNIYNV